MIRIALDPPKKPHALVAEVLTKLEQERVTLEQSNFEKLEAEFDAQLVASRDGIKTVVSNALKVLEDSSTLDLIVGASISFLQVSGVTDTITNQLSNMAVPSVNVELVDVFSPDTKIEQKIRQVEEKLNSKATERSKRNLQIFKNTTEIFLDEAKKNLQIYLNAFMVDTKAVKASVAKHASTAKKTSTKSKVSFRQIGEVTEEEAAQVEVTEQTPNTSDVTSNFTGAGRSVQPHQAASVEPTTFSELGSQLRGASLTAQAPSGHALNTASVFFPGYVSFLEESAPLGLNSEQLNVAVGESEFNYPSISDVVDQYERKRAASERLQRARVLQMTQKLMRAQLEMLKDNLHYEVAKSLTLLGSTASGLKTA